MSGKGDGVGSSRSEVTAADKSSGRSWECRLESPSVKTEGPMVTGLRGRGEVVDWEHRERQPVATVHLGTAERRRSPGYGRRKPEKPKTRRPQLLCNAWLCHSRDTRHEQQNRLFVHRLHTSRQAVRQQARSYRTARRGANLPIRIRDP